MILCLPIDRQAIPSRQSCLSSHSVLLPGSSVAPLKGPGHSSPFCWVRRRVLPQTQQTEAGSLRSARAGLLWMDSNGTRPQRCPEARGGWASEICAQGAPIELIPYGTVVTILRIPRKGGEEHSGADRKEWRWNHLPSPHILGVTVNKTPPDWFLRICDSLDWRSQLIMNGVSFVLEFPVTLLHKSFKSKGKAQCLSLCIKYKTCTKTGTETEMKVQKLGQKLH